MRFNKDLHTDTCIQKRALTWANTARLARYHALIKFTGAYACFGRVLYIHTNSNQHFIISVSHVRLSLSLSAFLSVRLTCRRNVGRASAVLLARTLPPISFPFQPLSLFYTSFPFVSALFVPLSCPLFLLSSRLSPGGARFSFLPAVARSFCPISRSQTSFHFRVSHIAVSIFSFSIIIAAINGNTSAV